MLTNYRIMSNALPTWFNISIRHDVVSRSVRVAPVVGTILEDCLEQSWPLCRRKPCLNQSFFNDIDHIMLDNLTSTDCMKILLTCPVPYCVATCASVGTELHGNNKDK